jgi:hypothetical protein
VTGEICHFFSRNYGTKTILLAIRKPHVTNVTVTSSFIEISTDQTYYYLLFQTYSRNLFLKILLGIFHRSLSPAGRVERSVALSGILREFT